MALLTGKRILVTGVLTPHSIAFAAARAAAEHGAETVLTSFGKARRLTERAARQLDPVPDVLELDVTDEGHWADVGAELERRWQGLDGALHAVAFAPPTCMGSGLLGTPWGDVATALHVSAFSLKALAEMAGPLMDKAGGGSIVGLDFDSQRAWPAYDWMGVAKSALESTARYLACELGRKRVRVNLVASGPIRSTAARAIPGFKAATHLWGLRAPLGWDADAGGAGAVAGACVALWSDLLPATTGEILHADGGHHAVALGMSEVALSMQAASPGAVAAS
ncbi:MAG: enoyl-ACP reductase FabI [Acidimicrobiales bacterium]